MKNSNLALQCDFHVHTYLSPCARPEMQIQDIINTCTNRGIKYLGLTDHVFFSTNPAIFDLARKELSTLDKPINVYLGCEADILDVGVHLVREEMKSSLDFIGVSANHLHLTEVAKPVDSSKESVARHILKLFKYACSLDFVDLIVHPMLIMPDTYDPYSLDILKDDEVIDALLLAKKNNIAIEISPRALYKEQMEFRLRFYKLCKSMGLKFSIGSDSHRLENAGRVDVLAPLLAELEITYKNIWLPEQARLDKEA